jgi:hypothetical protein
MVQSFLSVENMYTTIRVILFVIIATLVIHGRADVSYLTCERDEDCWTLRKSSEWCTTIVSCQKGRCTKLDRGPCHPDLEDCDSELNRCFAKRCIFDSSCPGGYCDEFSMRCKPGSRPGNAANANNNDKDYSTRQLPGDAPATLTGSGALTYWIVLAGSIVLGMAGTAFAYLCCII